MDSTGRLADTLVAECSRKVMIILVVVIMILICLYDEVSVCLSVCHEK